MSANIESLFYTTDEYYSRRNVPWHGLGQPVVGAPDSKEAIIAAGLDWRVEPKPIYDGLGNEIPGYKANTRDKDNKVLGMVTNKYTIVQNSEAFSFTDSLVGDGLTYETAGSLNGGKRIWLLGKMPTTTVLGENVEPYICLTNTFDGFGAIKVCMTPVRVVCNNTLNLALDQAKRMWSTKHMGDMSSKLIEARETLGLVNAYMKSLDEEADRLANLKLTEIDLEGIFDSIYTIDFNKDSSRKIKNTLELKAGFLNCLKAPDIKQYKDTAYAAVMAATDYSNHSIPFRNTSNFAENRWGRIISGDPFVDAIYSKIKTA